MSNSGNIKRIAFYIGDLSKGGAEHVIRNLAEYFHACGVETYMVTKLQEEDEYELSDGIERIIADITEQEEKGRVYNLFARIKKLRNIWKEIKPDIIVSFIRKNNLMALASAYMLHIPVVVSVRSTPEREFGSTLIRRLSFMMFKKAAGIVVLTDEAKAYFPGNLQKKIVIMPNAIDRKFIDAIKNRASGAGMENDIDKNAGGSGASNDRRHEIITVGRIDDNKNQKMLVDAFAIAADTHPEWTLHIYGDGEGRMDLVEHVIGLEKEKAGNLYYRPGQKDKDDNYVNISDRIIFHGVTDNTPGIMSNAAIFVLPSRKEGMPNALIEAMVMGMACISTDCPCGGPAQLIQNGTDGILIPVDDTQRLATELDRLMNDDELRQRMGAQATHLIDRVHPDIVCNMWREYLESLV